MKFITAFVIISHLCVSIIRSSNILVFLPSPWKSHIISFQPLFLELAKRGHNLTVISKFTVENPPPNYIQIIPSYDFDINARSDFLMRERSGAYMFAEEPVIRSTVLAETTEMFVSDPVVRRFVADDRSSYDLVFVEAFFQECTVALGHKYGAPVVRVAPMAPWASVSRWAANPSDPAYVRDFALDGGKRLRFWERVTNAYAAAYGLLAEPLVYLPRMQAAMDAHFRYPGHERRPAMVDMLRNVSLTLIDSDATMLGPRPYVPSFVEVPGIHMRPGVKMNEKLQNFMDNANTGVVYFNFGTILNVTSIPKKSLRILIDVLGRLEHKIVFRWINNDTRGFPDNFYVDSWFPQKEILSHPNCKLFISHGGAHGIMETIIAEVPFIGFPVFGDQFQNVKISQDNGIAIESNIFWLTEEIFEQDVKRILTDKKFSENIKRMSAIFQDRPMSALDTAVYWVEYVIRHRGAHHLRSVAVDLPWYQYYLLDVIAFVMFTLVSFVFVCSYIIIRIMQLLFNLLKSNKIKSA